MKKLTMAVITLLSILVLSNTAFANCDHYNREYAAATTLDFDLWLPDGTQHYISTAPAVGEILVSKDEGAEANCSNNAGSCVTDRGRFYSISLTGAELTTARLHIEIHDLVGTDWLDKCLIVETYNNASAQHPIPNVNVASTSVGAITAASLAANAINSTNIADSAITVAKIADNAITEPKIAQNAIGSSELADTITVSFTGDLIGDVNGISPTGMAEFFTFNTGQTYGTSVAGSVVKEIADNSGGGGGGVTIAAGGITAASFVSGAVDNNAIAANAIGGSEIAQSALAKLFNTDSGTTFGASVAGSLVSEIATNCSGGGGGGSGTNGCWPEKTAQAATSTTITLAANEPFGQNGIADNTTIHITDAGNATAIGQSQRVCKYTAATKLVTMCAKWQITPTGTIKYVLIPETDLNP